MNNQIAILNAKAKSMELPETIDCETCEYEGTCREFECWRCEQETMDEAMEAKIDEEMEK